MTACIELFSTFEAKLIPAVYACYEKETSTKESGHSYSSAISGGGAHSGIVIRRLIDVNTHSIHQKLPHRDDHYQFIFQEKGSCALMVDFQDVTLKAISFLAEIETGSCAFTQTVL